MVKDGLSITGVPTSYQSKLLCRNAGIPIADPFLFDRLDLAIDGADEIDKNLNAIKGGGAAHAVEKIIATMAHEFVIIADESKLVENLGVGFPIPLEVLREATSLVIKSAKNLGAEPKVRTGSGKDGPVVTENGNIIIDLFFKTPPDIYLIEKTFKLLPGVLETGLFINIAKKALIATETGVKIYE